MLGNLEDNMVDIFFFFDRIHERGKKNLEFTGIKLF